MKAAVAGQRNATSMRVSVTTFCVLSLCSCISCGEAVRDTAPPNRAGIDAQKSAAANDATSTIVNVQSTPDASDLASTADEQLAEIITPEGREWVEAVQRDMDPANDGWSTELFAERAGKQLQRIGGLLTGGGAIDESDLAQLVAPEFRSTPLRPARRERVFSDDVASVERAIEAPSHTNRRGASEFAGSLTELANGPGARDDARFKFKLFRIANDDEQVDTTCYFELSGRTPAGAVSQTAVWQCRWKKGDDNSPPLLSSIVVTDYEEVRIADGGQPLFTDVAAAVFREAPAYREQLAYGIDYWRSRVENYFGLYFDGLHGIAVADVNGDGLDDIYVCEPGGLPNRLFLQTAEGRVVDASAESGVNFLDPTRSALLIDLDNDRDQDLVLPIKGRVNFFANDGQGRFTSRTEIPVDGQTAYSLAAADYDSDGDLDVYACYYHGLGEDESNRLPAPIPLHDARTGGPNRMFRNDGDWRFADATEALGLNHNNDRWSYAAVWEDFDNDGDVDLYVANDFGRNNLYRNDDGKFTDVAAAAGAEDMNFGMAAAAGDYDRDGAMDLYVSNMFSAAGGRITWQPEFQTDGTRDVKNAYQRMVRGNTLFKNRGDGTFRDVSDSANVTLGRWAWGSLFADVNNDGWEDLLIANGFVTGNLPGDL